MKCGSLLFGLVLLIVLAIPLFADHALVNPVGEAFSNSSMNTEEVPFSEQELFDSNIAILAVGLKQKWLSRYTAGSKKYVPIENTIKIKNIKRGVRRIKSDRH